MGLYLFECKTFDLAHDDLKEMKKQVVLFYSHKMPYIFNMLWIVNPVHIFGLDTQQSFFLDKNRSTQNIKLLTNSTFSYFN